MRKITLTLLSLLCTTYGFAQYSTGLLSLSSFGGASLGMTAQIDVSETLVTLTLTGASTDWLGIGFDATGMGDTGMDVVIFDGTNLTDRTLNGVGVTPPVDASQNWTVTSNTVNAGVRTVVGTRALDTGDANDHIFTPSAGPLTLVYARRSGSTTIGYHGSNSCGSTVANFALSADEFSAAKIKMYPNPARAEVHFELPAFVESGEVKIYDVQGRMIKKQAITSFEVSVPTNDLTGGSYLVVIRTNYGNVTKTLIIE